MAYARTSNQKRSDFAGARAFENEVGEYLGPYKVAQLSAPDDLDFWVPELMVDVKEKRQKISARWPLPPGIDEVDCFILDELSVRRALRKSQQASYFLIRDVPGGNRLFLAPLYEVIGVERTRLNREGKGKWIIDLTNFRQLPSLDGLLQVLLQDQIEMPWKKSNILSHKEIPSL